MTNFITFGGVKLDQDQINTKETKILKNKYGYSEKYYIIDFKNGQKVAYTESQGGHIFASKDPAYCRTDIFGVNKLELIGSSKDNDLIDIANSEIKYVDVSGDGGGDMVKVTNCKSDNHTSDEFVGNIYNNIGAFGEIATDKGDDTDIKHTFEPEYTREGKHFTYEGFGVHRFDVN